MAFTLPWGRNNEIELRVPEQWLVTPATRSPALPPLADLAASTVAALAAPTAGPALVDLARAARNAIIVIDDVGRPTPAHLIAPAVLSTLLTAGLAADSVAVVFATGTHRPMTADEMRQKAGAVVDQVRCFNHDCRDDAGLKFLGTTRRGTPVNLNRMVADADLRVLIGTIEPHPQAGFGGGLKNLLPGCAGALSVGHNHLVMPSPDRYDMIGTQPDDNPMRLDIEEAAGLAGGRNFIVNTVLGADLRPVALVAGEAVAAHRAGVAVARGLFGARVPARMDAVITSSFPMDVDLRQGVKGIANMPSAVRTGGAIICFLQCDRGMEDYRVPGWMPPLGLLRLPLKLLGARGIYSLTKHLPKSVPAEKRFVINFGLQVLKDRHVLIFSPRLAADTRGRFGNIIFDDQDTLFRHAERLLQTASPRACLIPEGGASFPLVEK